MSMMTAVKDFIATCPYLTDFASGIGIGVDILDDAAGSYVLEHTPVDPILETYIDGSAQKQFAFVFASREFYGLDVVMNIENVGFFEKFASWLDAQTRAGNFPVLGAKQEAESIEATITPYLYDEEIDKARYQIQCRLVYDERI